MRLDQIVLRGTFAARPLATSLPNGSLYASTDTNEIYEVIAQAWQLFVDGDGGGSAPGGTDKAIQYNNAGTLGGVTVNATATKKYLQQVSSATPTHEQVADADLATTDIVTNDVSPAKHGFAPKGDGNVLKFLNANAVYSIPTGTGAGAFTLIENKIITIDTDSVVFSSLDGDAFEIYKLIGRIISGAGGTTNYGLKPNGVTTNLHCQISSFFNGGAGNSHSAADWQILNNTNAGTFATFDITLHVARTANGVNVRRGYTGTQQWSDDTFHASASLGGLWSNWDANLTTLEIFSSLASRIRNGSTFSLYHIG